MGVSDLTFLLVSGPTASKGAAAGRLFCGEGCKLAGASAETQHALIAEFAKERDERGVFGGKEGRVGELRRFVAEADEIGGDGGESRGFVDSERGGDGPSALSCAWSKEMRGNTRGSDRGPRHHAETSRRFI